MKKRSEVRERIRTLREERNYAKQFDGTDGYVYLTNGAIRALEWTLGYKRKPQWWCYRCAILHNGLECPRCGNAIERKST